MIPNIQYYLLYDTSLLNILTDDLYDDDIIDHVTHLWYIITI